MKYLAVCFTLVPSLSWWAGLPWLGVALGFGVFPMAEWVLGRTNAPAGGGRRQALSAVQWGPHVPRLVALVLLLQVVVFSVAVFPNAPWDEVWWLGAALGVVGGGVGIVFAHELGHRRAPLDRWLALILLTQVAFGHYHIEHNRGHHRIAASHEDPASARQTESLWAFMGRYFPGVWRGAVELAAQAKLPVWLRPTGLLLIYAAWTLLILITCGPKAWVGLTVQTVLALYLVAAVDYVEHWGLVRRRTNGRLEKMAARHIWDCDNWVSDALLINLPRHAHHHLNPSDSADRLTRTAASPQMPTGYAGMVMLAAVWPLFRKVMTPRLPAEGDLSAATTDPT